MEYIFIYSKQQQIGILENLGSIWERDVFQGYRCLIWKYWIFILLYNMQSGEEGNEEEPEFNVCA
jgi:hypothetical protein